MIPMLRASAYALLFALSAISQTVAVAGTGCAQTMPLLPGGAPQVGMPASICYAPNAVTQLWGVAFTSCGPNIPLPFGANGMCHAGCVLYGFIQANFIVGVGPMAGCLNFMVPNNPGLVGASYCAQVWGWGIGAGVGPCYGLTNAIRGTVVP